MKINALGAALFAGVLSLSPLAPARAASIATNVFLDNLVPNVDFLDRSSRMALTHSKDARVKGYAAGQAKDQTVAANALDEWIRADRAAQTVVAQAQTNGVITGRSVAIDAPVAPAVQPSNAQLAAAQAADTRLPMGQEDLDFIDGLSGKDFDQAYKEKQAIALRQIITDYQTYIAKGDDPMLLGIANRELPKAQRRLQALHGA